MRSKAVFQNIYRGIQLCSKERYAKSHRWVCSASHLHRSASNMAATDGQTDKHMVGVCQMTCTDDKVANFKTAKSLVEKCKSLGAQMVFLPEACDYIANSKQQSMEMAETMEGETIRGYRQLAQDLSVWISLGGFHQMSDDPTTTKLYNTHVILDDRGEVRGTYSKTHLFDLDIPGKVRLCESDYTIPGNKIAPPVGSPIGNIGMGICYDMRFPEMAVALLNMGADVLTYPSAFTVPTGKAHWHVLLRNRAIESQCYVIAAAQTGRHNEKRTSYGHSVIISPWGEVLGEVKEGEGVAVAQVDCGYIQTIRTQMPVQQHKRHDLYGNIAVMATDPIDCVQDYDFGKYKIGCKQVFFRTSLSYAFVNIKPVVKGHVLVASIHNAPRLSDLNPAEIADLFNTANHVSKVIEKHFKGTSLTISVQDGPEAGQTVQHVHVHILPRKVGDFARNDEVYDRLQDHDKDLEAERQAGRLRTEEEMNTEAAELRRYFS